MCHNYRISKYIPNFNKKINDIAIANRLICTKISNSNIFVAIKICLSAFKFRIIKRYTVRQELKIHKNNVIYFTLKLF